MLPPRRLPPDARRRRGHAVELVEEPVDRAAAAGVVGEGLADDLAGQVDRERADLAAQLVDDLLPLGGQLLLAAGDDAGRLLLRLGRSSSRICCPSARAWSRICAASVRASASCARYCSSAALASACIASARSMPPSIASRRARKTCSKRGATNFAKTKQTIAKAIEPDDDLAQRRDQGLCSSAARMLMLSVPV